MTISKLRIKQWVQSGYYLVDNLLSQSVHDFRVQSQEHNQRGGCAGRGLVAAKQQLSGRLLNGLRTDQLEKRTD